MDLFVSLQNVTKRLGERTILNSTSIDFKEGEITAIVAPNGTGKTTTINLISGFMSVDGGELIFSDDLTYKDVAVVFGGDKNLYMKNTVEENIYYLSMLKGLTKSQIQSNIEKLKELIPHYEELSKKMCEHLSHGQKRMAAIFAAIVSGSKVIIFDEATEGLDQQHINMLKGILTKIRQEKIVIICSHDYDFVESLSDKIYFLKETKFLPLENKEGLKNIYAVEFGE